MLQTSTAPETLGSSKPKPTIRSYDDAALYLGSKQHRPLYYATRVNRRGDNIAITHHETDIITYHPAGDVVIDTAGWHTVTTKARLNRHLPGGYRIYQEDSIWYISISPNATRSRVFYDGMVITPDGQVQAPEGQVCAFGDSGLKELNKRILKYSRDYIKSLFAADIMRK